MRKGKPRFEIEHLQFESPDDKWIVRYSSDTEPTSDTLDNLAEEHGFGSFIIRDRLKNKVDLQIRMPKIQ